MHKKNYILPLAIFLSCSAYAITAKSKDEQAEASFLEESTKQSINKPKLIRFANVEWLVRNDFGGPGPNYWSSHNAWVDSQGYLHLKITHVHGKWYCAEVSTSSLYGFGQYWFYILGSVDRLDPNVIFGLFNYPPKHTEPDGTHELDIEFSKWGINQPTASNFSYTVWPKEPQLNKTALSYTLKLEGDHSTYGFIWDTRAIVFQSSYGHNKDYAQPILNWVFSPPDSLKRIPQKPLRIHINLWLKNGAPPMDGKEVEVIVKNFCYKPKEGLSNCTNFQE